MPIDNTADRNRPPVIPSGQDNLTAPELRVTDAQLAKILIKWSSNIELLDKEKRIKLFRRQLKGHQYYDGNFYAYVDENCELQEQIQGKNDRWYQDNQFYSYIRTALMELNRRQTKVQVNASNPSEETERIAEFFQKRYEANRARTFTALLKQTENIYALLNGITFRYTFFDFNPQFNKQTSRAEQTESEEITAVTCAECQMPREDSETPCEHCGSTFTESATSADKQVSVNYDQVPTGENSWCCPNPISIIVSMQASSIKESPFLKWKQLILRSVLEHRFENIKLPHTTTSPELRYIVGQQTSTPADSGGSYAEQESSLNDQSEGKELELLEFQQIWLDYPVYAKTKFQTDCRLSNGKVLPANTALGEMFPDGLYYALVGDVIVDIWNEDKNAKWTSSPYSLRANSMYGAGTSPAHAQQELINDLKALQMANAWNNAVAREFVDDSFIDEISADPAIPTRVHDLPQGASILGNAYAQAPGTTLSPEIYGLEQNARSSMQNQIGALSNDAAGGLSDTQAAGNTATAITIRRDLAVGRFAPDLELLADNLDKEQAYQFLENELKHFTPAQWEQAQGDYDSDVIKKARQINLRRDLTISIVPESYMPKSQSQTIAALNGYAAFVAQTAQFGNPELNAYAAEIYNVPPEIAGWQADRIEVNQLIERFTGLAELSIEQNGDTPNSDLTNPQIKELAERINLYAEMPLDTWLDNHQAMSDALKDWRMTDIGRNASNTLVAVVAFRLQQHKQALVKQAQMDGQMALEAQQPMKQEEERIAAEQMQISAAANSESNAQSEQQAEDQTDAAAVEKMIELTESEQIRTHEAEQNAADRDRDVAVAQMNT